MPKNNKIIIFTIIFFGLILRLISVNQSLWLDEAISVQMVTNSFFLSKISLFMKSDFNPPLFNIILFFWLKIFPVQEFFIRLPSIIFGLLTTFYLYKISLLILKKNQALLPLSLLITSPLHIYYSQEARMYSLAAFTVSGSMYYFIKLIKTQNKLFTLHYSLFTILMLYSHYLVWLILPVQWFYLLRIKFWKSKELLLNFLISNILISISLIPLLPLLFTQLQIGQSTAKNIPVWKDVVGSPSVKNILLLPVKFIIGRTSFEDKNLYLIIAGLLMIGALLLIFKALKSIFYHSRPPATLKHLRAGQEMTEPGSEIICLWLGVPVILDLLISIKIPVFSYFRFLFCLPAFYLLVAIGIYSLKKPRLFILLILLINLFFSYRYLFNQNYHRENWQQAVKTLHLKNTNNDPVLIIQNVTAPFDFYDKGISKRIFFEQKEMVSNLNTVWLIPYSQPIFDPTDQTRDFLKNKGFVKVDEQHFRGVTLEQWQKVFAFRYN